MADRDKVDELVIELTARDKATEKIDNLARSLRGLGDSLTVGLGSSKLNSVANSLKSITVATQELGRSTKAINNLPKLTTELSNMMNTLHDAPSVSKDVLSLAHALSRIDGSAIKGFSNIAKPKVNTGANVEGMKALENEERKVDSQTKEVTTSMNSFGNSISRVSKGASLLSSSLKSSSMKDTAKNFTNFNYTAKKLSSNFSKLIKSANIFHRINNIGLKKGFTTLLRYTVGIRSLFVLANRIRGAIEDGNKNLAQYSDTFNKSMSRYKSGLGTLKNAMSVAFAPLVNYFSSAVNKILDSFINAFNIIARLLGRLTGAKQVVQATRYYNDFADSLGKAGKNANTLTTGIDELNILNDQSGGGGGGASTDVQDMFETVDVTDEFDGLLDKIKKAWDNADFFDFGKALGDKINTALQNIDWEKIRDNASKLGKSLATFLNGVLSSEINNQTLGYTIGSTIAQAINTGLEFANSFAFNFDWKLLGKNIADSFTGFFKTWDAKLTGETLSNFANGFIEALTSAITRLLDNKTFVVVGQKIVDFLCGINWARLEWNMVGFFSALSKALVQFPTDFAEGFWRELLKAIFDPNGSKPEVQKRIDDWVGAVDFKGILETSLRTVYSDWATVFDFTNLLSELPSLAEIGKHISELFSADISSEEWSAIGESFGDGVKAGFESKLNSMFFGIPGLIKKASKDIDFGEIWDNIKTSASQKTEEIKTEIVRRWNFVFENISKILGNIKDVSSSAWDNIKNFTSTAWSDISNILGGLWNGISTTASSVWTTIRDFIGSKWSEVKNNSSNIWSTIKDTLSSLWSRIKDDSSSKFTDIKNWVVNKWTELKTNTSNTWQNIKSSLATVWSNIKDDSKTKFTSVKDSVITSFKNIKTGIKAPINSIIGFVESMVNKIVDGVNFISDKIKEFTTFSWTNPITGTEYKSDGISLPKVQPISIPRLADGGYVPNTNMGSLFWAGENGAEIVANASGGTEVLNATQVASAVSSGVRQAIIDAITPYMVELVNSNQAIADKDMSVNIGDRDIAEANRRGEISLGLQLVTM